MTLTIALQNEMKAIIDKNGNIVIDIPDTCKRDLWDAQIEYWLEKDLPICKNTKIDGGFLRVIRNKIKHVRNNY
mgnify:CR=1 FL=1